MLILGVWLPGVPEPGHANVAFVGNSITFVNDLPRLLEALSGGNVYQNSCLHGSLNLMSIMQKGNGMYYKWKTKQARIRHVNTTGSHSYRKKDLYDFGVCSFPQLLFGYDANLFANDIPYVNDGMNPCLQSSSYLQYLNDTYSPPVWDFVVMNDQTVAPGKYYSRRKSMLVLKEVYANMFRELPLGTGRPVFLVTHAYNKSEAALSRNSTKAKLGDIPEFTSRIYYGYQLYAQTLAAYLPPEQEPLLAPAGLVFLMLWEENYGMWKRLFFYDGFHPSPHGTYVIGLVLYATLFQRMPPRVRLCQKIWKRCFSDLDACTLNTGPRDRCRFPRPKRPVTYTMSSKG